MREISTTANPLVLRIVATACLAVGLCLAVASATFSHAAEANEDDLQQIAGSSPGGTGVAELEESVCDTAVCMNLGEGSYQCLANGVELAPGNLSYANKFPSICSPEYTYNSGGCSGAGTPAGNCSNSTPIYADP